jgi:precorrin-6x reductase
MNKIALLNDAFRTSLTGGTVLLTVGVQELPDMVKAAAIRKVVARLRQLRAVQSPLLLENILLR